MDVSDVVGAVRRRWRIVVACVLLAGAAVGLFLYTRGETRAPTRYRVSVVMLVPGQDNNNRTEDEPLPENLPRQLLTAQVRMAQTSELHNQALRAAGVPEDASVEFGVSLSESRRELTLSVTSTDLSVAEAVAPAYADAVRNARRDVVSTTLRGQQVSIVNSVVDNRSRLAEVENQLNALFPNGIPTFQATDPVTGEPSGSEADFVLDSDSETGFLLFERRVLRSRILDSSEQYAQNAVDGRGPSAFAEVIDRPPPSTIVPATSSPTRAVAAILAGGFLLGLVGAVARDMVDRSIRDAKRASGAFSAPVLATIPAKRRGDDDFVVLQVASSDRSEAFRVLAATSVATDRLPRAIMVSSPTGRCHEDVAANFAAALATLGVRVALIATTPDQSWFLRPFANPAAGILTFPELLTLAQSGRLNGQVQQSLPRAEHYPNLVVVPPGTDAGMDLPFNGLPPLLDALARSGIDVTVIAGPPILESAEATIVAWATGSVMWSVQVGEATEMEAAAAVARLELAGVKSFGVAVVDQG